MAYRECPDMRVPASDVRCEAIVKAVNGTYQVWRREPHRCVRRAVQTRAGHIVCALHLVKPHITYWDGTPDNFRHLEFKHLERKTK